MKTILNYITDMIKPSTDLVDKQFSFGDTVKIDILYLKNMSDNQLINNLIIKPLVLVKTDDKMLQKFNEYSENLKQNEKKAFCEEENTGFTHKIKEYEKKEFPENSLAEYINSSVICLSETEFMSDKNDMLDEILRGNCLIIINEGVEAFSCSMVDYPDRTISEPPTSVVINGPRAGFVESINTNITLVRRRICNSDLKIEETKIGRYTKTRVAIMYISSIANDEIVNSVKKIISDIDIDGIIDSEYLVSYLVKRKYSLVKQIGKSEKPDVTVAKLLEGRVAILVDGSPICLSVPFIFLEDLQGADDYYQGNYRISLIRYLRLLGSLMAILLPGMYVAVQSFHYKLLPAKFLVTILNSNQGLPLTPFSEVLFILLLFEILYESSIRMPKYMGMALSIVGALVLGDTAVKAGLVSSPAVMLIALSGITIYIVPDESEPLSLFRLFFVLAGGTLGLFGISMGMIVYLLYTCSVDNYGIPYFAPIAPLVYSDLKDAFQKKVESDMIYRPETFKPKNKKRMNKESENK